MNLLGGSFGKLSGLLLLGLLVVVVAAPQIASAAEMEYITTNWAFDNGLGSGVAGYLDNDARRVTEGTWTYGSVGNVYLRGYRLNSNSGGTNGFFYLATGANDTNTGLTTYSPSFSDGKQMLYQTFTSDMSTNVLTFSLSNSFKNATGTETVGDYTKGLMNIAILAGEGTTGTVVWSTNETGGVYSTNLKAATEYLDDQDGRNWVNEEVNLSDVLTGGNTYTLMVSLGSLSSIQGFALTNVGIQKVMVPEPGTWAMLAGLSLVGGAWMRRRRK